MSWKATVAVLVMAVLLLSFTSLLINVSGHAGAAASVVNYLTSKYGELPAVILKPVKAMHPSLTGEVIITTSMQRPPKIPKPVKYPEPPGKVVVASSNSTSPESLLNSGLKFQYLIVTSGKLLKTLYPIAAVHSAEGMNVLIATINWIKSYFPAKNLSKSIRLFARFAHYKLGAVYLLLGGDVNVVPTAYWYAQDLDLAAGENMYKATDQYYAFLDGNWDPNGNGKLLESIDTNGDGLPDEDLEPLPDAVPDLYVGRLPAPNSSEMIKLVNDELNYLTNPPKGNWLKRAILLAAIANFPNELGTHIVETDFATEAQYIATHILIPHGYKVIRAYQDEGVVKTTYPHEYSLNHRNADMLVRMGSALLLSIAHGSPEKQIMKVWVNDSNGDGIPEKNEIVFKTVLSVGDNLSNNGRRPLTYLEGCLTGFFDYINESLAEYMLEKASIAVIASTRISYYQVPWPGPGGWLDQELTYLFWKELFSNASFTVGPALELSKYAYIKEHGGNPATIGFMSKKDILNYNLLGDPALRVWIGRPSKLRILVNATLPIGEPLVVKVIGGNGEPIPHALVAVYSSVNGRLISYRYTGASGSVTLKLPALEGNEYVYVVARKPGYTYGFARVLIVYPHAPPLIRIISPSNNTAYRGVVPIKVNITGVSGYISLIHVLIRGPGLNYSKTFKPEIREVLIKAKLRLNESGSYVLSITATDSMNNTVAKEVSFLVDNTPPVIRVEGVSNETYVNRTFIQFNVSISDYTRLRFAEVVLDGKVLKVSRSLGSNALFIEEADNLSEGLHALVVIAKDSVGLWRRLLITFHVDLTPPKVSVYPNINGSVVNQARVRRLIITCNDNYGVKRVLIWVDGKVTYNGTWMKLKEVNLTRLANGKHNVLIKAIDYAGNSVKEELTFYIDSKPPSVSLTGLRNDEYLNLKQVNVLIHVKDNVGIRNVTLYLNNKVILRKELPANSFIKSLVIKRSIRLNANGRYILSVTAADLAGNIGKQSITFIIDRTPPVVSIVSPPSGTVTNSSLIHVRIKASDNACLLKIKAYVNGSRIKLVNGEGVVKVNSSGKYLIKAYAIDCAGNSAFSKALLTVDRVPPSINSLSLKPSEVIKTPSILTVKVNDNLMLNRVLVYIDNSLVSKINTEGKSVTLHVLIPKLSNGKHVVRITAVDRAGNHVSRSLAFLVDNSPPLIKLINESIIKSGPVRLAFRSNESLSSFKATINGLPARANMVGNLWVVKARISNGLNTLIIKASDTAGNSVKVIYKITGLKASESLRVYAITAAAVSVILAIVSLIMALIYRKSKTVNIR